MEEGANRLVPRSLRQWCLLGLVISKDGGSYGGRGEVRGVEGGGGEGGERRRSAWSMGGEVSEAKCEWAAGWRQLLIEGH